MCFPPILHTGKLKPKQVTQCVFMSHGKLVAELALVLFSSASVTSHSMKGFPLKGDVLHFFLILAKSNQSTGSIHGVSPEALPSINVIPWETISRIDNRKNKYFCWEEKNEDKGQRGSCNGLSRGRKIKGIFSSLSSFSPKQSLYRTCPWANLFDMEKMWKQPNAHTCRNTERYLCWSSELALLRDNEVEMVGWLGMMFYFVQSLREHSRQEAQFSSKFLETQESKEKGQRTPRGSPCSCHTLGTRELFVEWMKEQMAHKNVGLDSEKFKNFSSFHAVQPSLNTNNLVQAPPCRRGL